ncbi:MAG: chloride channel protein, partial [Candidatus Altiarchaeales archaeon]|nr:chloride channel protein [Candidatus Altiarchaeales archaeon]
IVFYLILRLILGVISVLWVTSFYRIEDFFDSVKISPVFKAGMGGVFTGLLGILTLDLLDVDIHFVRNNILGVGYAGMEKILSGPSIEIPIAILILLGIAKILATSFTIGSGGSGGVFSSSLYIRVTFGVPVV